ncbi:YheC/YheD family endospore coat-associated protein [Chengkuizengella marina]|uniref:YheC/YheD family protein n=1 Tax=Chengkuizengella marina TaxID=2507566 RepID=A0A6N9PZF9_9BACL|nr:YheC/YheD family protein [Chengkuizengella marina]NBI28266.1 YheC/YheD family protein [Chengkuizengella marina]
MSVTTSMIHFTDKKDNTIYVSNALMHSLRLDRHRPMKLRLGEKKVNIHIKRIKRRGKHLYIPNSIRNAIQLPRKGQSYVIQNKQDEIKLGPLIGILCHAPNRTMQMPFGDRSYAAKQYLKIGSKQAFYFAFTLSDVNWKDETVTAFFIDSHNRWKKKTVPLPDVVYNRLTSRVVQKSQSMQTLRDRFKKHDIPIFNWDFFDKWDIYHLLQGTIEGQQHVPETTINPSSQDIKNMLDKHRFIYLKPTKGSLGIGIFRITYHPSNGYFVRFRKNKKNQLLRFSSFSSLMKFFKRKSFKDYILQQGIRLIEIDNRPIDFRFHLNKDGNNDWAVAGIAAKKAGRGSVTTHVKSGGQVMETLDTLKQVFKGSRSSEIYEEAKRVTTRLANTIERKHPHLIGELGFDIGIDKDGRVWMFEANSIPGRSIFKHPSLKARSSSQLKYIFDYCVYLSKQRTTGRNL